MKENEEKYLAFFKAHFLISQFKSFYGYVQQRLNYSKIAW